MNKRRTAVALIGLAGLLWLGSSISPSPAGELEPPGPPAPTMRPLDQIETRRPIYGEMLPLTITESGSYYLAEDIITTGAGITISAGEVTIDLNGHSLCGGSGHGIHESSSGNEHGVTVTNGTVCDWSGGGVDLYHNGYVENVLAIRNGGRGISVLIGRVVDSIASDNGTVGVYVFNGVVSGTISRGNDEDGFLAGHGVLLTDCVAEGNGRHGIFVQQKSYVINNLCTDNSKVVAGSAGIYVAGIRNRIDGNFCNSNPIGIHVDGTINDIIRNSALGNTLSYDMVVGNNVGPIGSAVAATSPWANLQ